MAVAWAKERNATLIQAANAVKGRNVKITVEPYLSPKVGESVNSGIHRRLISTIEIYNGIQRLAWFLITVAIRMENPGLGATQRILRKDGRLVIFPNAGPGYWLQADKKTCSKVHPCDTPSKGGCAQKCSKSGKAAICSCNTGYVLAADKKSCEVCCNDKRCQDYRGTKSVTKSGRKCQAWDSQTPHKHPIYYTKERNPNASLAQNFCRNPDWIYGVNSFIYYTNGWSWCFTTDPEKEWEFCDIPRCPNASEPSEPICPEVEDRKDLIPIPYVGAADSNTSYTVQHLDHPQHPINAFRPAHGYGRTERWGYNAYASKIIPVFVWFKFDDPVYHKAISMYTNTYNYRWTQLGYETLDQAPRSFKVLGSKSRDCSTWEELYYVNDAGFSKVNERKAWSYGGGCHFCVGVRFLTAKGDYSPHDRADKISVHNITLWH